ncbi:YxeA family protein [Carnobacterium divergens]|uniref:YxeA family protein n=2 Tax=Carnobacterium divergens TaxID=2748 RepID=UPI001430E769|nr:YxeA family protein [Carnobacterium divergens]MDT1995760.1 YxeA family protein [Carnobacterium divergens]
MKKVILSSSILLIILAIAASALAIIGFGDRFNPLVKSKPIYVLTSTKDAVKVPEGGYHYTQKAYNQDGDESPIKYYAGGILKEGAYLKLDAKGDYVREWEEVTKNDVPKKALEKLNQLSPN